MSIIFGNPCQLGFVVRDIEAELDVWVQHGVGPWFYIESVDVDDYRYRGRLAPMRMSVAIANSGPLQIELIQQRSDAPALYSEFLEGGRDGFHHIAYWTTDYQKLYDEALSRGYLVAHEGSVGGENGRFAYFERENPKAGETLIEISDVTGAKGPFFDHVREAALGWDGSDPIRRLG